MTDVLWTHYPTLAALPHPRAWLTMQGQLGRAPNTVDAYGRALEDYLTFCAAQTIPFATATREHIALYVNDLMTRPNPHGAKLLERNAIVGLANATLQQRLTVVRLVYDYLVEEGVRPDNPVGRGWYTRANAFGGKRGGVPRYHTLPWIPTDDEWLTLLGVVKTEPLRNRLMFALAYDAALRREELCALTSSDIDPSQRLLRIRAETTKNMQERRVPYSAATSHLYAAYLAERRNLSHSRGPLFLSQSPRNKACPITIWTWSKVVESVARRAGLPHFSTHTLRHLCLTDLARTNWDIHEIALFAGHRSVQSTLVYIHLSARDLSAKIERGMAAIHAWRISLLAEVQP